MLPTLLVTVLIIVVGVSVLAYRNRSAKGIESGISSFRRELRALAPESDEGPRAAAPPVDPPRTSGVGVLREPPRPGPDDAQEVEPVDGDAGDGAADDDAMGGGSADRDAGPGTD